jgi:hypothetical protein
MKRIAFFALCVLTAAGAVSAQTGNRPGPDAGRGFPPPARETITGNLGISRGMISLESGGTVYHVMGLNRFIGFIDGLKEGAAVSLTGYAFDSPRLSGSKVFRVTELGLNGKSYDLAPPAADFENRSQEWVYPHHRNSRSRDKGPGYWGEGPGRRRQERNGQGWDSQGWDSQGWDSPDRRGLWRY